MCYKISVLIFISLFIFSCSTTTNTEPSANEFLGKQVWTAVNLRVSKDNTIHWQNYLNRPVLVMGTPIRFKEIDSEKAVFESILGAEFTFFWKGSGSGYNELFEQEFHKYFAFENPQDDFNKLSSIEHADIEIGNIRKGMSKQQVLMSWGYPINSYNPMRKDIWLYWFKPGHKVAVYFDNNVVVQIQR